jgi:TfoX/Sxy family transcriptional regulator of competence genes
MSYNENLSDRVREIIALTQNNVLEQKMFGGLCFMVNDKMLAGVLKDRLLVRIDPSRYEEVMEMEGCGPMDFTGKVMKSFVSVDEQALKTNSSLAFWIDLALEYNEVAKASKKKKK